MKSTHRSRTPLLFALAALIPLAGCATKSDVEVLRTDMYRMQQRQDSAYRESQMQIRMLLDTLRQAFDIQRGLRGETSYSFDQLGRKVDQLDATVQQLEASIVDLLDHLERTEPPQVFMPGANPPASGGMAAGILAQAKQALADSLYMTARNTFRAIVRDFSTDPLAAEAQFHVGETFAAEAEIQVRRDETSAAEMNADSAIAEFRLVHERWPHNIEWASRGLLRAGIVAQELLENRNLANSFYDQIPQFYPNTPAAAEARQRRGGLH